MPYRPHFILSSFLVIVTLLAGCSHDDTHPATPDTTVKRIQANPNLSPQAQQSSLQNMNARQTAGRIRGQLMHHTPAH